MSRFSAGTPNSNVQKRFPIISVHEQKRFAVGTLLVIVGGGRFVFSLYAIFAATFENGVASGMDPQAGYVGVVAYMNLAVPLLSLGMIAAGVAIILRKAQGYCESYCGVDFFFEICGRI